MQSSQWYLKRLSAMSPPEVFWRLKMRVRDWADRWAAARRRSALAPRGTAIGNWESVIRPGVAGSHLMGKGENLAETAEIARWRQAVVNEADEICENRLTFFDLVRQDVGPQIDWNYEYKARVHAPMDFSPRVDYRDYRVAGDAKFVWEPNRHQHLVVLGRAYCLTGDTRYAAKAIEHIESWIRQCPFGIGMNWRSPLELAIRLINWVWTYELVSPSGLVTKEHAAMVLPVAYRHLWSIARSYSRYSSANNHLVGEAAGVYIGSSYFQGFRKAGRWQTQSKEILVREIFRQVNDDGGHRELATGYHLFVLEFFLLAALIGRNRGDEFPRGYWDRLEKMMEYLAALAEGGDVPMFGDSDDGYVLNLGGRQNHAASLLALGAAVFGRADLAPASRACAEPVFWILGSKGCEDLSESGSRPKRRPVRSAAMRQTGYYLLQCGHRDEQDRISVAFDCGDLGFGSIAAHGHADALSFTLRAFGGDLFVDPGTYDYFTYPQWRSYFRSTAAHNAIVIDGKDQSEMLGLFLWGRRAKCRCLRWEPSENGGTISGEHDGYACLADPVIHRRTLTLVGERRVVEILDELSGNEEHSLDMYLHLAEHCIMEPADEHRYSIRTVGGTVCLQMDPRLTVQVMSGGDSSMLGWISRGYHRRQRTTTCKGSCRWSGRLSLLTRIDLGTTHKAAGNIGSSSAGIAAR